MLRPRLGLRFPGSRFRHANDLQDQLVSQRSVDALNLDISVGLVERNSSQRRTQLEMPEAFGGGGRFGGLQDSAADTAALPSRPHEECPNARRIRFRVEKGILAAGMVIAPVQRLPPTPAATGDDSTFRFDGKVCPVMDELCIDTEYHAQCGLPLFLGVVGRL